MVLSLQAIKKVYVKKKRTKKSEPIRDPLDAVLPVIPRLQQGQEPSDGGTFSSKLSTDPHDDDDADLSPRVLRFCTAMHTKHALFANAWNKQV